MAAKFDHTNNKDEQNIFSQFSDENRDSVKKMWAMSANVAPEKEEVSTKDIESALTKVHKQIDTSATAQTSWHHKWKWGLAAAVMVLAFGLGYLLLPQTVTVPRGEVSTVRLPDGSTVELNSGSTIRYNRLYNLYNRTIHLNGEAFFAVQKGSLPFTVKANGSAVQVTGTQFNVRSWDDEAQTATEVAVAKGTVRFYPGQLREQAVHLSSGQLSRWHSSMDSPSPPETVSVDQITGWRNQELVFNKKSLRVIFNELERRFDVDIQLEGAEWNYETLTTYYGELPNVETVLKDICRVKGLRYTQTANGYRVFK